MTEVHDEASKVVAEDATVLIDGPGIVIAFTPEAAAETADRLYDNANEAFRKRHKNEREAEG